MYLFSMTSLMDVFQCAKLRFLVLFRVVHTSFAVPWDMEHFYEHFYYPLTMPHSCPPVVLTTDSVATIFGLQTKEHSL